MILLELFPTVVGVLDYEPFDREAPAWRAEIQRALRERQERSGTAYRQTDDRLHERPELVRLVEFFQSAGEEYLRALRCSSGLALRIQCCWATVALQHDSFELHQHANSFLSGAFYLDVEDGAEPILFRDPRAQNRTVDLAVEEELRINQKYYRISPRNGRLIVFPAWLEHRVGANQSTVPRVSMSFNMTVHGELGSTERLSRTVL